MQAIAVVEAADALEQDPRQQHQRAGNGIDLLQRARGIDRHARVRRGAQATRSIAAKSGSRRRAAASRTPSSSTRSAPSSALPSSWRACARRRASVSASTRQSGLTNASHVRASARQRARPGCRRPRSRDCRDWRRSARAHRRRRGAARRRACRRRSALSTTRIAADAGGRAQARQAVVDGRGAAMGDHDARRCRRSGSLPCGAHANSSRCGVARPIVGVQPACQLRAQWRAADRPSGIAPAARASRASARPARRGRHRPAGLRRRARRTRFRTTRCASPGPTGAATGRPAPRTTSRNWRRPGRRRACARCRASATAWPTAAGSSGMQRRHRGAGAREAFGIVGHRGDLADARPRGGFAGVAPGRRGARSRRRARRQAASCASQPGAGMRIGREHDDIGIAAGRQHFVQVRDFADAALAPACSGPAARVRCSQRSMIAVPRGPACASSASHTRVPAACRRRARPGRHRARRRRRRPAAARSGNRGRVARGCVARSPLLRRPVQRLHRAEAAAVFVGQVARFLRIADDGRRQQDDDFVALGAATVCVPNRPPITGIRLRPGKPDGAARRRRRWIRPASITVSPLWIAASVFSRRVLMRDVAVARSARCGAARRADFLHDVEEHHAVLGDARAHLQDRCRCRGTAPG